MLVNIFCYSALLECNISSIWCAIKSINFVLGVLFGRPGTPKLLLCIPWCIKVHLINYIPTVLY